VTPENFKQKSILGHSGPGASESGQKDQENRNKKRDSGSEVNGFHDHWENQGNGCGVGGEVEGTRLTKEKIDQVVSGQVLYRRMNKQEGVSKENTGEVGWGGVKEGRLLKWQRSIVLFGGGKDRGVATLHEGW